MEGLSAKRSFKVRGGVRGGYECKMVIQGARREYAEGCAEGLSAKRSFKVRGGVRGGYECKKVIQGAWRDARRGVQRGAWRV